MKENLYEIYFRFREYYDNKVRRGERTSWDDLGMALAFDLTPRVTCKNHIAGCCVLDSEHRIVALGYNGPVRGDVNCREAGCAKKDGVYFQEKHQLMRCRGMHGEDNAILNSCMPERLKGSTFYVTLEPCFDCFKKIVQIGVKRVVYGEPYERVVSAGDKESDEIEDHPSVIRLAETFGVELVKFKIPEKKGEEK